MRNTKKKKTKRENWARTEASFPELAAWVAFSQRCDLCRISRNALTNFSFCLRACLFFPLFPVYYSHRLRLNCAYEGVQNCQKTIHKSLSSDSIKVEQHRPGISVTSKNMEMCSKSMCININTAECSRARRIIRAMDIYAVTQNELAVTLPGWEELIKRPRFYTEGRDRTREKAFNDNFPKPQHLQEPDRSYVFALFMTHVWEILRTSVIHLSVIMFWGYDRL